MLNRYHQIYDDLIMILSGCEEKELINLYNEVGCIIYK